MDAQDRLLVVDRARVLRLEADGSVTKMGGGVGGRGGFVLPGDRDDAWVFSTYTWDTDFTFMHVTAGAPVEYLGTVQLGADTHLWGAGRDAQGQFLGMLRSSAFNGPGRRDGLATLDGQTGEPTLIAGMADRFRVDAQGRTYGHDANGDVAVYENGQVVATYPKEAVNSDNTYYSPVTRTLYTSTFYQIYEVDQTGRRLIAGLPKQAP